MKPSSVLAPAAKSNSCRLCKISSFLFWCQNLTLQKAFIGITHNLLVLCFHKFGHGEVFQDLFVEIIGDWPWGRNRSDHFLKTEPIK